MSGKDDALDALDARKRKYDLDEALLRKMLLRGDYAQEDDKEQGSEAPLEVAATLYLGVRFRRVLGREHCVLLPNPHRLRPRFSTP